MEVCTMAKKNNEKFNEEISEELCTAHESGLPLTSCAKLVGLHRNTVGNWLRKGQSPRSKYHQFYKNWQRANAEFQKYHLKKINDSKDWRASQYLLQVTSPSDYVLENKYKIESEQKVEVRSGFDKELFEKILSEYDD